MNAEAARKWCEVLSADHPHKHVVTTQGENMDRHIGSKLIRVQKSLLTKM
jgi:hypothetical protein